MQWKLAPRNRLAQGFHEWAMRWGFPFLMRIAHVVPRWFLFLGAKVVIDIVMAVYPAPKPIVERNLSRILPPGTPRREIRRLRRRMMHHMSLYWADLFRFARLPYERAKDLIAAVEGKEHLDALLDSGRGCILLTAHLGNWELGGALLRETARRVSVVYVPDQSPTLEAFRKTLRDALGVEGIAINPRAELSSLPVLRALREGRVVALQGDRDFNDRGEWVDFFGAPAPFPLGPILLARLTGVPLLPIFIAYDANQRFVLRCEEPIEVETTGDRGIATRRALERWVRVLESAVARWPDQWYTFYDLWTVPAESPAEEPAQQRREAV